MRSGLISRLNKMIIAILLPGRVVACNSTLTGGKPTPVVAPEGWTLVWQDEFDGKRIDPKTGLMIWAVEAGEMARLNTTLHARKMRGLRTVN